MPPKQPSAKYLARAGAFAEAIDIGTTIAKTLPEIEWGDWDGLFKKPALEPELPFANLKSLGYLEDAFFTYWNETGGEHVERFWQRLAERALPFERKDVVRDVLSRGRIRTQMEYQTVNDSLVIQQQLGRISQDEAESLGRMMGQFEQRAKVPKRSRSD